jgi:hypothetical protein
MFDWKFHVERWYYVPWINHFSIFHNRFEDVREDD